MVSAALFLVTWALSASVVFFFSLDCLYDWAQPACVVLALGWLEEGFTVAKASAALGVSELSPSAVVSCSLLETAADFETLRNAEIPWLPTLEVHRLVCNTLFTWLVTAWRPMLLSSNVLQHTVHRAWCLLWSTAFNHDEKWGSDNQSPLNVARLELIFLY